MKKVLVCLFSLFVLVSNRLYADEINVAVASNFNYALQQLAADFTQKTGHVLRISNASSGKLYAQIVYGAPYDLYLSADEKHPDLLIKDGRASAEHAYVYALGKLVFLSNVADKGSCQGLLSSTGLKRLAIANPKVAPYGMAATQVLEKLDLWQGLQKHLVLGENIAQTMQFISTKNADAGFVAQSMVDMAMRNTNKYINYACLWDIPTEMYAPIRQKLVLLNKAKNKPAAQSFLRYIKSTRAKEIIRSSGYDVL